SRFLRISWTGSTSLVALALGLATGGDDRDGGARADPVRTGLCHLEDVLGGAHTTGGLHADVAADDPPHQLDVLDGRAALAEAGLRLHERRALELRERSADDLLLGVAR